MIYLDKKILTEENLSLNAVAALVAFCAIGESKYDIQYVSLEMLCYQLYGNAAFTEEDLQFVQIGMQELEKMRLISVEETTAAGCIVDVSGLKVDWLSDIVSGQKRYISVERTDVNRIFANISGNAKWSVLQEYLTLLALMKTYIIKGFYKGDPEDIDLGVLESDDTFKRLERLEELDLIYRFDEVQGKTYYCSGSKYEKPFIVDYVRRKPEWYIFL